MGPDDLKSAYGVLELPPDAPLRDVHIAYLRLKKIYSSDSIALMPLGDEFSDNKRKSVLEQVDQAYAKILSARKTASGRESPLFSDVPSPEKQAEDKAAGPFSGPTLRKIRERAGIELAEISKELKLRSELLKNIEEERFEALPEAIYLRVHLKNYARLLRLDPAKVVGDYLARFIGWKDKRPI